MNDYKDSNTIYFLNNIIHINYKYISDSIMMDTMREFGSPYLVPRRNIEDVAMLLTRTFTPHVEMPIDSGSNFKRDFTLKVIEIIMADIRESTATKIDDFNIWNTLSGVNDAGINNHQEVKINRRFINPLNFQINF